jgi:hypothetical protein
MILAHAFGARYDLPIPLLLFVLGGAAVVVLSFLLVLPRAVAHRETEEAPTDGAYQRDLSPIWGVITIVLLALLIVCGIAGSQEVPENLVPTAVWLLLWIAVPLSVGLLGDWTQPVNPFRWVAVALDRPGLRKALLGTPDPLPWPRRLGWWPAVVIYFVTACGELIYNEHTTVPRFAAYSLLSYACFSAIAGLLFGAPWQRQGEMFTVLFDTWGRLGWFRFGAPGRPGFAGGLGGDFDPAPSRTAFVLLLLVSVNLDGLLATPKWNRFERHFPGQLELNPDRLETFRTVTFVVLALAVALAFTIFAMLAVRAGGRALPPAAAISGLLPSLLPIAFGYLLAHNLQYLLVNGQLLFPLIGNPVGKEGWPIHLPYPFNDDYEIHKTFLPSSFYWYVSVLIIVAAHVIAVVLAHQHLARSARTLRAARASEYPWLVAMVAYTMLSLWLIAQPLVEEGHESQETASHVVSATLDARATSSTPIGLSP